MASVASGLAHNTRILNSHSALGAIISARWQFSNLLPRPGIQ